MQAGGSSWTLEEACREIEVLNAVTAELETIRGERDRAVSEKDGAVKKRDDVYQSALQEMGDQLKAATSMHAAWQTEQLALQRCDVPLF